MLLWRRWSVIYLTMLCVVFTSFIFAGENKQMDDWGTTTPLSSSGFIYWWTGITTILPPLSFSVFCVKFKFPVLLLFYSLLTTFHFTVQTLSFCIFGLPCGIRSLHQNIYRIIDEKIVSSTINKLKSASSSAHIQTCVSTQAYARTPTHTYAQNYTCACTRGCCTLHLTHTEAGLYGFLKARNKEVHRYCKSLLSFMFTNALGMEEEPLKLLIQEKGIRNVVYNNVNGNASVLCPYFIRIFAVSEPWTYISQRFHNLEEFKAHRNDNIKKCFPSLFVSLEFFKLSVGLKNYTVNMASPEVVSLFIFCKITSLC